MTEILSAALAAVILWAAASLALRALEAALGMLCGRPFRWRAEVRRDSRWILWCDCGSRRAARTVARQACARGPYSRWRVRRVWL